MPPIGRSAIIARQRTRIFTHISNARCELRGHSGTLAQARLLALVAKKLVQLRRVHPFDLSLDLAAVVSVVRVRARSAARSTVLPKKCRKVLLQPFAPPRHQLIVEEVARQGSF